MIIICPCEQKKFNINDNLIPKEGRLVKCGVCNHTWFFKPNENREINEISINKDIPNTNDSNKSFIEKIQINKTTKENVDQLNKDKKYLPAIKKENKKNFLKYLLVVLISIIALIILIDTFKGVISFIVPNINFYLDNLYQSLIDIKLFTINLIK